MDQTVADPTPSPYSSAPPLSESDSRLWAGLANFGNILGFLPSLLIFLILGPRSTYTKDGSREALNFSITVVIVFVALIVVSQINGAIFNALPSGPDIIFGITGFLIGLVQFALWIVVIVFSIIAGTRFNSGVPYRYPFALRLVK